MYRRIEQSGADSDFSKRAGRRPKKGKSLFIVVRSLTHTVTPLA